LIIPRLLYPISEEVFEDFFASVRAGLVVEQSHQGQLFRILRMFLDVPRGVASFARSGSNPITAADVVEELQRMSAALQRSRVPEPEPLLG
jgi:2-oxoglutarate ferredoxin oxidoreductase subunit alpha